MKTVQYKIRGKIYLFPKAWSKDDVVNWVNTDIKVCQYCGKVDAGIGHYGTCSPIQEQQKQYNYKQ